MRIVVRLQVPGMHWWKDAPDPVAFLKYPHRHVFHIECQKEVSHGDREIEIIMFKTMVEDFIRLNTWTTELCDAELKWVGVVNFGPLSCEHIATELVKQFKLSQCTVLEDGENGCVTYPQP